MLWTNAVRSNPAIFEEVYPSRGCTLNDFLGSERDSADPLLINTELGVAADRHSEDMAARDFVSHTSSDGRSPFDRMADVGYISGYRGENIAAGQYNAFDAVMSWACSDGHRRNLLNDNFFEIGAGAVENERSKYERYWTQKLGGRGNWEMASSPAGQNIAMWAPAMPREDRPFLSVGSHTPALPEAEVRMLVSYWHPQDAPPEAIEVFVNGVPIPMTLAFGTNEHGTYEARVVVSESFSEVPASNVGGGGGEIDPRTGLLVSTPVSTIKATTDCSIYHFRVLVRGEMQRFPENGSYGWGACAWDDSAAQWVAQQLEAPLQARQPKRPPDAVAPKPMPPTPLAGAPSPDGGEWDGSRGCFTVDDANVLTSPPGAWSLSNSVPGFLGRYYSVATSARSGGEERRARFPFGSVAPPGRYDVWVRYTSTKSGSWGVPVDIEHAEGRATRFLDQRIAGGTWVYVGTYPMTRDSGATIRTNGVAGGVVADAIEFCQSTYDEQPRVGSDGLGAGAPCARDWLEWLDNGGGTFCTEDYDEEEVQDCVLTTDNAVQIALDDACLGGGGWDFTDVMSMYENLRDNMEQCESFDARDVPVRINAGGSVTSTIQVPTTADPRVTRVLVRASVDTADPTGVTMTLSAPGSQADAVVLHQGERRPLESVIFDDFHVDSPRPEFGSGWVGWWLKENFPGWLATFGISAQGNELDSSVIERPTQALISISQEEAGATPPTPASGMWSLQVSDRGSGSELEDWSLMLCSPPASSSIVTKDLSVLKQGCSKPERAACPAVSVDGGSCLSPGGEHHCGFVAAGMGYDTMPPPSQTMGARLPVGIGGTFVQPLPGRSAFCSTPGSGPASAGGGFEQTAWVEPRVSTVGETRLRLSLQLYYKQDERDSSWELVAESGEGLQGTSVVRASARTPPGCWIWVVTAEQGYGLYDLYQFSERF